jgi:hypothetical protein
MLLNNEFQPDRVMPAWKDDSVSNDLPTQLHDFFETFDSQPKFKVTVQSFSNEQYTGRPSIIGEYTDEVPNYEKLVKTNGAKYYRYKILYDKDGITKKENIDVDLTSKNWELLSKEGDNERRKKREQQIKEEMDEKNALMAYSGNLGQPQQSPREAMKETLDMMTPLLSLMKGGDNDGGGMGTEKMMMFMMQMQQQSNTQMMNMFAMMNKTQADMSLAMLGNNNNDGGIDKMFGMAERMIGMKELLSPKEETLIDKVGNFIGNNIDTLGELLSKPKEVMEQDTGYKKVKEDWRFKKIQDKMQSNEMFAKKLIEHLDGKVGNETTDKILDGFIKYKRHGVPDATEEQPAPAPESEEISQDDFD